MDLGKHLRDDAYLRERLSPTPGDATYLHLADLRIALGSVSTDNEIKILDYGCGGSPYRSLFSNADYRRADYLQDNDDILDYVLSQDSCVAEADRTFDFILSTQVLEHVHSPSVYLRECYRLLRPGGKLYITTHGTYPDHGCPDDFYRWTTDGLVRDLSAAGFIVRRVEKHTTGPRAALFHLECQCENLWAPRRTLFGALLFVLRSLHPRTRRWLHRMCDEHFARNRVVTEGLERHRLYIVTACLAEKP